MTRLPRLARSIVSLLALAACTAERRGTSTDSSASITASASIAPDSLAAALSQDTTIIETATHAPSDAAVSALLARLGFSRDEKLASAGKGCELRELEHKSDTLSSSPRMRCHMRGDDADVVIQAEVSPEGFAERLLVRDAAADSMREPLQTIELDLTEPFRPGKANLYTEDFDGDGVRELLVRNFEGATGNFGYDAWRFDTASRHFAKDTVISKMRSPVHVVDRPCVRESWNTSVHDRSSLVECFVAGRWVDVWRSETHYDAKSKVVRRSLSVRIGDSLRVVRRDSLQP